jgi:hypothetical protein
MLPRRCIHDPCRNMDVTRLNGCRPGSVRQTTCSPIGKGVFAGSDSVSSPGMRPPLQTDAASAIDAPAPWYSSHASTHNAMSTIVT